jgi:hypothetical protein
MLTALPETALLEIATLARERQTKTRTMKKKRPKRKRQAEYWVTAKKKLRLKQRAKKETTALLIPKAHLGGQSEPYLAQMIGWAALLLARCEVGQ